MGWSDGTILINIGAIIYIIAFAVRGELTLRILTLIGNGFYIAYYLFVPEVTLWVAIASTTLMTIANVVVMSRIALERTTWGMSDEDKALYSRFDNFNPGQFRRLLKAATRLSGEQDLRLTLEGQIPERLYFLTDGTVHVSKGRDSFPLRENNFIGEVAWLLNGPASATVISSDNAEILAWDSTALRKLCDKWPDIDNALRARINRDLAQKLSGSVQQVEAA
ncbi:cyclic nucleotide-binding domain-containing protein [Alterisphingorhabdus coralli]|uniref:Cyclic nucleotide-binding domain-containing protein n=1 Tax=Alterisphingorhabdus coralli TaxID=3071408 RepID=A0AA97F631_9SPHN|nr:cyclic nucleotide-binding domain-containing protein [Parasphingorhabdus sp. SCSIO 66989]WOE74623.1 cyclic nucleotide-binding domain-containing protein [Parasphingorhabdus sp. SCSIO 66989]